MNQKNNNAAGFRLRTGSFSTASLLLSTSVGSTSASFAFLPRRGVDTLGFFGGGGGVGVDDTPRALDRVLLPPSVDPPSDLTSSSLSANARSVLVNFLFDGVFGDDSTWKAIEKTIHEYGKPFPFHIIRICAARQINRILYNFLINISHGNNSNKINAFEEFKCSTVDVFSPMHKTKLRNDHCSDLLKKNKMVFIYQQNNRGIQMES